MFNMEICWSTVGRTKNTWSDFTVHLHIFSLLYLSSPSPNPGWWGRYAWFSRALFILQVCPISTVSSIWSAKGCHYCPSQQQQWPGQTLPELPSGAWLSHKAAVWTSTWNTFYCVSKHIKIMCACSMTILYTCITICMFLSFCKLVHCYAFLCCLTFKSLLIDMFTFVEE